MGDSLPMLMRQAKGLKRKDGIIMKVFDEMDFNDIRRTAWSGAVDTAERIEREGKGDEFCDMLEELYPDGISRTELNDIMWFDSDWIFETLGISEEEEEEEEREEDENA